MEPSEVSDGRAHATPRRPSLTVQDGASAEDGSGSKRKQFGTFDGVLTPTLLTILGVIV